MELTGDNYSRQGMYFLTLRTQNQEKLFGEIKDDEIALNAMGMIVNDEWIKFSLAQPEILLDSFVVMPDHVSCIVSIISDHDRDDITTDAPLWKYCQIIDSLVSKFQDATTKILNEKYYYPNFQVWQDDYDNFIMFDKYILDRVRKHIINGEK